MAVRVVVDNEEKEESDDGVVPPVKNLGKEVGTGVAGASTLQGG